MKTEFKKLPKKFKAKWIKALRSGDYEQGRNALYKDGKFCCIGVECHLHGVSKEKLAANYCGGGTKLSFVIIPDYMDVISKTVFGFRSASRCLIDMNDSGKSFDEIANWIENNL